MSTAAARRRHIVTVDVEDYFQAGAFGALIPFEHWQRFETRIRRNTEAALTLLARYDATATFFASGWIAEQHPEILRLVTAHGHEVACQGFYQQSVRELAPGAFREDLRRARAAVEQATGQAVRGFRIGRGWIGPEDFWVLDVLAGEGFAWDASVLPRGRAYRGLPECFGVHERSTASGVLTEVPASAIRLGGVALPFSGGNYVRQLPTGPVRAAARRWMAREQAPLVSYFHIWELDIAQPGISGVSWLQRVRHYRNLAAMPERIAWFLAQYPGTGISAWLGLEPQPASAGEPGVAQASSAPAEPILAALGPPIALTVVVPCFNESDSLAYLDNTLEAFQARSRARLAPRFVLVDDGSTDDTWTGLQTRFGGREGFRLLRHETNRGIAAAILTGAAAADTESIAVLDADCSFDPMQLNQMAPLLTDGVAAVCGTPRFGSTSRVPAWRRLMSQGAAFLYRLVLHHKFGSYTSCFRVYRREALAGMEVFNQRYCGVTEILVRLDLAGMQLEECRALLDTRVLGSSKINTLRTVFDHLRLITRVAAARWLGLPLPRGRRVT